MSLEKIFKRKSLKKAVLAVVPIVVILTLGFFAKNAHSKFFSGENRLKQNKETVSFPGKNSAENKNEDRLIPEDSFPIPDLEVEPQTTPAKETFLAEIKSDNKSVSESQEQAPGKSEKKKDKKKKETQKNVPRKPQIPDAWQKNNSENVSNSSKAKEIISFTFVSQENPWSQKEREKLESYLENFYSLAEKVFGSPAFSGSVNIRKNPESGSMYWQNGEVFEIILPGADSPKQLLHEMLHSFRGPYAMENDAFEEGMARAAEVKIMSLLSKYEYDNRNHSYSIDVFYEANNQSAISAEKGEFFSGFVNALLRYQQAGYAWGKCLIEDENFLANFNKKYYQEVKENPEVARDAEKLEKIASKTLKKAEGRDFSEWFSKQLIFDFHPQEGYEVFFKRDTGNLYVFYRDGDGREKMVSGASFSWKAYDCEGEKIAEGKGKTNSNGWDFLELGAVSSYSGRVRIKTEIFLPDSEILKRDFSFLAGVSEKGVFGIVEGADEGVVRIKGKGVETEAQLKNGSFSFFGLENEAGVFHLEYVSPEGEVRKKTFTKDASAYYVILEK